MRAGPRCEVVVMANAGPLGARLEDELGAEPLAAQEKKHLILSSGGPKTSRFAYRILSGSEDLTRGDRRRIAR